MKTSVIVFARLGLLLTLSGIVENRPMRAAAVGRRLPAYGLQVFMRVPDNGPNTSSVVDKIERENPDTVTNSSSRHGMR